MMSAAAASRLTSSARTAGASVSGSFCRPSRGPTSQIVTRTTRLLRPFELPQDLPHFAREILRQLDFIVLEAASLLAVDLDEPPRSVPRLDRDHQQGVVTELLQQLHLVRVGLGVVLRHGLRSPLLDHRAREWIVRDQIAVS